MQALPDWVPHTRAQVIEFALPEDIERLRNSKKRDLGVSEKLQLLDDAICGVSSIELQWRWVRHAAGPSTPVSTACMHRLA